MTVEHNRSRRGLWMLVIAVLVVLAIAAATLVYFAVVKKSDSAAIEPGSCPDLSAVPCVSDTPSVSVPLAGDQLRLAYAGDRLDGGVIQQATWHGWTLDQHHTYLPDKKLLLLGDGRTRSVAATSRTSQGRQTLVIGAADGSEVYEFDTRGRQLRTLDGMTGAQLLSFGYDEQGRLTSMTAGADRKVTLDYGNAAVPRTITVNGSEVAVSGGDRVNGVSDTDGANWLFDYNDAGLLSDTTDPARGSTSYAYEGARLAKVTTPRDGSLAYDKKRDGTKSELTITADTGERTELSIDGGTREYRRTGQVSISEQVKPDGGRHVQYGDGRVVEQTVAADPRFGVSVPVFARQQVTYPGKTQTEMRTDRKVELADNADPLSLKAFHQSGSAGKLDYDASGRTLTSATPAGRISTTRFDEQGRTVSRSQPGQQVTEYHYDNTMLTSVSQGERTRSYSYDRKSGALNIKDPAGTSAVTVDSGGRVAQQSIGDGQPATFDYDPAGRLVGATPPGRATHVFTAAGYAPPTDLGSRIDDVWTSTDTQGRATGASVGGEPLYQVDHPGDGAMSVKGKDFGLSITPDRTGLMGSAVVDRGERVEFGYDGDRLREQRLSGPVQGTVSTAYGADGRPSEIQLGADGKVQLGHDPDGGLTKFGAAVFDRDKEAGRVRSYTVGSVTVSVDYDQYGQVTKRSVGNGTSVSFRRDAAGRVVAATEHTGQGDRATSFGYDAQRRLAGTYDANGNPTAISGRPATYDARDRLRTWGSAKLDYDRVGRLTSIDDAGVSTKYGWDPLGRLISVGKVGYVVDALGRRTGKQVDGKLVDGWLYLDALHPVAELDGSGKVVATFAYDDLGHLVGMTKQGKQYAIVTDQRNSPVFVVEADTGKVAQQLSYDAVGNVVADSNPGLQPFGLAGGLYDRDTKLVHFGARDYSPALSRWLSPDPKGFGAGDTNLYRYAMGDPVNVTDVTGLDTSTTGVCLGGALSLAAGGAVGVCAQWFSDDPWNYTMFFYRGEEIGFDSGIMGTINYGSTSDPGKGSDLFGGSSVDTGAGAWVLGGGTYKPLPGNKGFTGYYGGIGIGEAGLHKGEYTFTAWGEPHLKTAKGTYDFMGVGEFVAATDGSDTFQVQVRQRPIPDSPVRASMITALAATVDGDKVGVYQERAEGDRLRVNGKPAAAGAGVTVLPHGGTVIRVGRAWTIRWRDGTAIEAQDDGKALAVSLAPSAARAGKLKGLLGTADGKLVKPDGKEIDTTNWPPSFDAVHKDFGPSWRLAAGKSLFEYQPGESTDGFYDPNYATTPPDVSKLPADVRGSAERLCEPLKAKDNNTYKACVLDVAVMGDARFAVSALRSSATKAPAAATPTTTTVNTGVLHDGDVRTGRINSAEQHDSYELDVGDATQVELQDVTGDVQAHLVGGDNSGKTLLPGPYEFAVSKPGRYQLEVTGTKPGTDYRFRFVTLKPRRFQVKAGDQIGQGGVPGTGRLDVPGRVDLYLVDPGGTGGISVEEGSRCDDQITVGMADDEPQPHVFSPYQGCWYPGTGEPGATGKYVLMVWSNTAKTGDYSFRIKSGR